MLKQASGCTRRLYNLYCVGADVKPCSVNQPASVPANDAWHCVVITKLGGIFGVGIGAHVHVDEDWHITTYKEAQLIKS